MSCWCETYACKALEATLILGPEAVPLFRSAEMYIIYTEELEVLRVPSKQSLCASKLANVGVSYLPHSKVKVGLIDAREVAIQVR